MYHMWKKISTKYGEHECIYVFYGEKGRKKCEICERIILYLYGKHDCSYFPSELRPGYSQCSICGELIPIQEHKCKYNYTDSSKTGYVKCIICGKLVPLEDVYNNNYNQSDTINTTKIVFISVTVIILAVGAYIALSIRKKIKDKKYYSIDE